MINGRAFFITDPSSGAQMGVRKKKPSDATGAGDIHDLDNHETIVQEPFVQYTGTTTTPNAVVAQDATVLPTSNTAGFAADDEIKIYEGTTIWHVGVYKVLSIVPNTSVTIARPLDTALTATTTIERVVGDMNVAGSLAVPVKFEARIKPGKIAHAENVVIAGTSGGTSTPDGTKFINQPALTNGIIIRQEKGNGIKKTFGSWSQNKELILACGNNADYTEGTLEGINAKWSPKEEADVVLNMVADDGDAIRVYVQDDLTALSNISLRMICTWHYTDE